jgi:hypothetical protein
VGGTKTCRNWLNAVALTNVTRVSLAGAAIPLAEGRTGVALPAPDTNAGLRARDGRGRASSRRTRRLALRTGTSRLCRIERPRRTKCCDRSKDEDEERRCETEPDEDQQELLHGRHFLQYREALSPRIAPLFRSNDMPFHHFCNDFVKAAAAGSYLLAPSRYRRGRSDLTAP